MAECRGKVNTPIGPPSFENRVTVVNHRTMTPKIPPSTIRVNIMRSSSSSYQHLGNPFALNARGMYNDRELVCSLYEQWLRYWNNPKRGLRPCTTAFVNLQNMLLETAYRIELVCCCKPLKCHGDVLKKLVVEEATRRWNNLEAAMAGEVRENNVGEPLMDVEEEPDVGQRLLAIEKVPKRIKVDNNVM